LLSAVSRRAREEWAKQWLKNPDSRAEFDTELGQVGSYRREEDSTYNLRRRAIAFATRPAKTVMGPQKPSTLRFRLGTDTAGWEIQKDSDNLPELSLQDHESLFPRSR